MKRLRWAMLTMAVGAVTLFLGCGGSNGVPYNPTPAITGLFPSNITAGSDSFVIFVSGTGFISNSMGVSFAYWNGSPRSTTYNPSTAQLSVYIPASDVASTGIGQLTVNNPAPGGGMSAASSFTIVAAQAGGPAISSFSPVNVASGGPAFTLTINGTNFAANDSVVWNGSPRTTTFVNSTQVTAAITQQDISAVGTGSVSVVQPGLLFASRSVAYPITGASNPVPGISGVSPSSATHGATDDLEVTVSGGGFVLGSVVEWGNVALATSYISGSDLVALIPASDLAAAGTVHVGVTNPAPGGGTSASTVTFTIN